MHMNRLNTEMMSRIASLHARCLCMTLAWSDLNLGRQCTSLYGQWTACRWWSVCSCCDKQEVRCCGCLNLSRLCYGFQCCTLAVAQHCPSPTTKCTRTFNFCEHAFKIYGIWLQAHKCVTNTLLQCSPASVGLAQARPNILLGHFVLLYTQLYMCKSLQ